MDTQPQADTILVSKKLEAVNGNWHLAVPKVVSEPTTLAVQRIVKVQWPTKLHKQLGEPKAVRVYFAGARVGIKPSSDDDQQAIGVSTIRSGLYGVTFSETTQEVVRQDEAGGIFYIDTEA